MPLAAEPAARMVSPSVGRASFLAGLSGNLPSVSLPQFTLQPDPAKPQAPAACVFSMPSPPAGAAARLVGQSAAQYVTASIAPAELRLPALAVLPALEALEIYLDPPPCAGWMPAPEPEPVASVVRCSVAGEALTRIAPRTLRLALVIADPQISALLDGKTAAAAEPVMSEVYSSDADTPLELFTGGAGWRLAAGGAYAPALARVASGQGLEMAGPAAAAPAMAVESALPVSAASVPASAARAAQIPPFALQASTQTSAPGFENQALPPPPPPPNPPAIPLPVHPSLPFPVNHRRRKYARPSRPCQKPALSR